MSSPGPSPSSSSSSSSIKILATTHVLVFIAGVVAGKGWNADELAAYRSSRDEERSRRLKKLAGKAAFGFVAFSIAMIGMRVRRSSS